MLRCYSEDNEAVSFRSGVWGFLCFVLFLLFELTLILQTFSGTKSEMDVPKKGDNLRICLVGL